MLLSFSVENFRSFKAEQTLSLMASKRLGPVEGSPHCYQIPGTGEHALRVASLYGANAAGKSNLVRAISLLQRMVLSGTSPSEALPHAPFHLDPATARVPTSLDVQFAQGGVVFRYGLVFDSTRVLEEWLDVYEGTRARGLFARTDREGGAVVELGPAAGGEDRTEKMVALATLGARRNQLFLTGIANLADPEGQGPRLHRAVEWFGSALRVMKPGDRSDLLADMIAGNPRFAEFASRLAREADTGVAWLTVNTRDVPRSQTRPGEWVEAPTPGRAALWEGPEGRQFSASPLGADSVRVREIEVLHEVVPSLAAGFPLWWESDGVRRFLHLLPELYRLRSTGGVFVIDEFERSMHPMLARKFIEFFLKAGQGTASQLIFTTHETNLLDLDLMRRDGIWFAEKDNEGATQLYSLADFKVRNDLRIEKGYLQGRFGAIPFLGGIDRLIEEQAAAGAGE